MGESPADTAEVRFGNRRRLIPTAVRSSSVPETTTPHPPVWKLARTRLRPRIALRLMIFFDTALALDLKTGQIKWAKRLQGFDTWNLACFLPTGTNPNCPVPTSQDFDLGGAAPISWVILLALARRAASIGHSIQIRQHRWSTPVGPGSSLGGQSSWGTATDGQRIYVAIGNRNHLPYTWCPRGSRSPGVHGALLMLPLDTSFGIPRIPLPGLSDTGSVSVANDVMYAGSNSGQMYALDTRTGRILWNLRERGLSNRRAIDSGRHALLGIWL